MEVKCSLRSIEQWYERATNLDRYWRENRRKEKRLRGRREMGNSAPRMNIEEANR